MFEKTVHLARSKKRQFWDRLYLNVNPITLTPFTNPIHLPVPIGKLITCQPAGMSLRRGAKSLEGVESVAQRLIPSFSIRDVLWDKGCLQFFCHLVMGRLGRWEERHSVKICTLTPFP